MHVADRAAALAPQERRPHGVLPHRALEGPEHHDFCPRVHEVDVVRARVHRRDLRARGPRGHLRDRDRPVAATKPLHVAQAGVHTQHVERARARRLDVVVPVVVDFARQHHAPLDPRIAQDLERRRVVVRERVPYGAPVDRDRLQRMLVADDELLDESRVPRAWRGLRHRLAERRFVVGAKRRDRARTGRRLDDHGISDGSREGHGLVGRFREAVPRARQAGRAKRVLHLRLVPEALRDVNPHAGDAERLAHLGERHLELLVGAKESVDRADTARQLACRPQQLVRVQDVVHAPVRHARRQCR